MIGHVCLPSDQTDTPSLEKVVGEFKTRKSKTRLTYFVNGLKISLKIMCLHLIFTGKNLPLTSQQESI